MAECEIPETLLDLPARYTTRVVALDRLDELVKSWSSLRESEDTGNLHDYRVTLRRLRVLTDTYHEYLEDSVSGKVARRLGGLTDLTAPGRDLEVNLQWIESRVPDTGEKEHAGLVWLRDRMVSEREQEESRLRDKMPGRMRKLETQLRKRLSRYSCPVDREHFSQDDTFAAVTARLLREHTEVLRQRLAEIELPCDETLHHARISGKLLRYVVEPVAPHVAGGRELVGQLRSLQRVLGEITDACALARTVTGLSREATREHGQRIAGVLSSLDHLESGQLQQERELDPSPGLYELALALQKSIADAFRDFQTEWRRGRSDELLALAAAVSHSLADRHQLPSEVERKYLLRCLPQAAGGVPPLEIAQGYLPGTRIRERIRAVVTGSEAHWYRTIKLGAGISRVEIEEEISGSLFESLWPLTAGRRLRKRRYLVPDGDLTWEIDEFLDRDLFLAEVELHDQDMAPELPDWLAPCVDREVTGEEGFLNVKLAR